MDSAYQDALRVAAYCRVSTDKDDQLNSLAAQQRFFYDYIQAHPGWSSAGIFADEGLSGTSVKRRPAFAEMVRRALNGEIGLIVTKEVSRFARNTVDALQVTRRLKEAGVGVLFLNDNIDTRDNDGEFRLTIMASVAQEESRKISERTRWGQLQAMKRGVVFGNRSLYGYTLSNGMLTVQPEQAEVVRQIFFKFLEENKGTQKIAGELTRAGVAPPLRPDGTWSAAAIARILRNEKYCGDLLQKKYRTIDYLTHRKIPNDGTEAQIFLQDHHTAIVSRAQFEAAQAKLAQRAAQGGGHGSARYWFSGKIRCGACGRSFALKRTRRPDGREYQRFVCRGRLGEPQPCGMDAVRAEVVAAAAQAVLGWLGLDGQGILAAVLDELAQPITGEPAELERIRQAVQRQTSRRRRALEAFLDGDLSRGELHRLTAQCQKELERLSARQTELERCAQAADSGARQEKARALIARELAGGGAVLDEVIQTITVFPDHFLVEVWELPVRFFVRAEGRGTGAGYRAVVTACVPLKGPGGDHDADALPAAHR